MASGKPLASGSLRAARRGTSSHPSTSRPRGHCHHHLRSRCHRRPRCRYRYYHHPCGERHPRRLERWYRLYRPFSQTSRTRPRTARQGAARLTAVVRAASVRPAMAIIRSRRDGRRNGRSGRGATTTSTRRAARRRGIRPGDSPGGVLSSAPPPLPPELPPAFDPRCDEDGAAAVVAAAVSHAGAVTNTAADDHADSAAEHFADGATEHLADDAAKRRADTEPVAQAPSRSAKRARRWGPPLAAVAIVSEEVYLSVEMYTSMCGSSPL